MSNDAISLPVFVSNTTAVAGRRHPIKRRWFASSSAIGQFAVTLATGQVAITFIAVRSITTRRWAVGTFTEIRDPERSSWNDSGPPRRR
jgi:hypothetical protein